MLRLAHAVKSGAVLCALALWSAHVSAATAPAASTDERVAALAQQVMYAEDLSAIKRLQRSYGYFVDKGLWTDLAEYFTDDAVANYPAGTFIGKESIGKHLYRNVGSVAMGEVGLGQNRLYNHMNVQPVVHIDPAGTTAHGRWRALAMLGSLGASATWAEGVYAMQYRKEHGVWRISKLDYYSGFAASYATGWVAPPATVATAGAASTTRARRELAHPADQERDASCDGFAAACVAPFTYNPTSSQVWPVSQVQTTQSAQTSGGEITIADLARRAARLRDEQQLENLLRIYGYYYERAQWDQVADLFARDGTVEFAQQGVFLGRKRVREYFGSLSSLGLKPGTMNDRMQLQIIVTVAPDGNVAYSRSREFSMTGVYGQSGEWSEGIYENRYVKRDGHWQIASMHFFPTFQTNYDEGWGKQARPAAGLNPNLKPDRPPSESYEIFPKAHIPAFHFRNVVTGKPVTYPAVERGGPSMATAAAALSPDGISAALPKALRRSAVEPTLRQAEQDVARFKDYHAIENLESTYGYYLDKNLWDPLADLFASDGSIELAMRGVYRGARVRGFLLAVFGRGQQGPVAGRLGNHVQLQPVITVAEDGQSAKVRLRMMQQMSMGARASIGASIYENEVVKEAGVWKFSKVNTFNTLSANYAGGWAKAAGRGMPGISKDYPPDAPPTRTVVMFPILFDTPFHYANPVSGRTDIVRLPPIEEQLKQFPLSAAPSTALQ
jgi:SnoaL-like domain